MGTPRLFQIFVVLGSAFMILLIIIYWDDEERYVPRREWKIHLTPVAAELQQRQVACTNWKRQSESVLQDGEPVADPGVISKGITHNSGAHLSLDRFWHRYGMFSRNNMKGPKWGPNWGPSLSVSQQLYKLYEPDFRLFGYERPDAILEE